MQPSAPQLFVLSGLPGVGKTSIARLLVLRCGAVWLRIDTIEQAIVASAAGVSLVEDAGYRAAYGVAEDNLRLGLSVVADAVNGEALTRDAWLATAARAGARAVAVEVVCSDPAEHRRRVETRIADVEGHVLPTWSEVLARDYQPWERDRIVVDTAVASAEAGVELILRSAGGARAEQRNSA
jgi:predicted kinase